VALLTPTPGAARPACPGTPPRAIAAERRRASPLRRSLPLALAALLLAGCPGPGVKRPVAATPYDAQIHDLNLRLCAERGAAYDLVGRRCVELP
jgi:hypothetical protein